MRITEKQAKVTKYIIFQNDITIKFTANRTYRLLPFCVGEWALQHNRPLLPLSRAKSHEIFF